MNRTRRAQGIHQGRHARNLPTQPLVQYQTVEHSEFDNAPWAPNGPIHDVTQFQPPHLTLAVPFHQPARSDWLAPQFPSSPSEAEPTSSVFSPDEVDAPYNLPTYAFEESQMDWKPALMEEDAKPQDMYDPFTVEIGTGKTSTIPITVDPQAISRESTAPPTYSGHSSTKIRSAHRKAIEEKSSIKRKNAEYRLSQVIATRLGGTFVPGLANQLNQAADLLEQDDMKIRRLEEENRVLRARAQGFPVDIKRQM